jgi:DNA-binding NtrC family response regulator
MKSMAIGQIELGQEANSGVDLGIARAPFLVGSGQSGGLCFAGRSVALLQTIEQARQAAASEADVLIEAESGTGKEILARMIHGWSRRRARPFVAVNCAAVPETLLESELFGHARGAYTGANAAQTGQIELAQGGTLLLDEIGEMPLHVQPKLLRVLQERELRRLGDNRSVRIDIRVVATTNRSLAAMVRDGLFRADLYYRLHVIALTLPPLRERRDDVPLLAEHFLARHAPGKSLRLAPEFLARLCAHKWPGNVRELENSIRRAVALSPGEEISADLTTGLWQEAPRSTQPPLSGSPGETNVGGTPPASLHSGMKLQDMERELLVRTLDATSGNRSRAAALLGISLRTVRNKIREYGLPARRDYVVD